MHKSIFPRLSTIEQEGFFQCSKWVRMTCFLDEAEMKSLLEELKECKLFPVGTPALVHNSPIDREEFIWQYKKYLLEVSASSSSPSIEIRRFFTLVGTPAIDDLFCIPLGEGRFLVKPCRPVLFFQLYHCYLSPVDKQFHSMALNPKSIFIGLQISYPQIWEDPKSHTFTKTLSDGSFAATPTFRNLLVWQRKFTKIAMFQEDGQKIYAPFRIGKTKIEQDLPHQGLKNALKEANFG